MFDMNIKQPSHKHIRLSGAVARVVEDENGAIVPYVILSDETDRIVLDENDAVRFGAFLVRFYRERNRAEIADEAERIKASRAAKAARHAARKAAER